MTRERRAGAVRRGRAARCSVNGVRLEISYWFFALLAVLSLYDSSGTLLAGLAAALLHEGGHLFCVLASGGSLSAVKLRPLGCELVYSESAGGWGLAIALSGAAANIAAAGVAFACSPLLYEPPYALIAANLCLGLVNLLPVAALDGAQALETVLSKRMDACRCERVSTLTSFVFAVPVMATGIYVLFASKYNFSLLALGLWLFACSLRRIL